MDEILVELRRLLRSVQKHKRLILIFTLVCGGLAFIATLLMEPVYESTALLRVRPQKLGVTFLDQASSQASGRQSIATYTEIMKSRGVIQPIIESGKLNGSAPDYGGYAGSINTAPVRDTEMMRVMVTANEPREAQLKNELLLESFLKRLTEASSAEQKVVRVFIGERVQDARKALEEAEDVVGGYRLKENIVSPDSHTAFVASRVTALNTMRAENKVTIITAQARLASLDGQMHTSGKIMADNPIINGYKQKIVDLEGKRVEYEAKFTPDHPFLKSALAELQQVRVALDKEIDKVVRMESASDSKAYQELLATRLKTEADMQTAMGVNERLDLIERDNEKLIRELPVKEQKFVRLMRDAGLAQDIYVMLAKRYEEAKIAEAMVVNDVQVFDLPTLPGAPIRPQKTMIVFMAIVFGLMASIGAAIAFETLNRRIRNIEDVENYLGLPVLGTIPDHELAEQSNDNNSGNDALKIVKRGANSLKEHVQRGSGKIKATVSNSGKTLLSFYVGIYMLVDCWLEFYRKSRW